MILLHRILAYLFTAYTYSTYKWGFYAFGTLAYLLLAFNTLAGGHRSLATRELGAVRTHHLGLAGWTNLLWLNYPIAFGISDGGNVIGVTGSFIYFGILDLLLVPVLALAFVSLARKWDYGRLNIAFTQYGRVRSNPGTFPEKEATAGHAGHTGHAGATGPAGGPVGGPAGGPVINEPAV